MTGIASGREQLERLPRPWIFNLSGGVARGAAQAGFLVGLIRGGFVPDGLVGMSAGSLNAAYAAWRPGPEEIDGLLAVWRQDETAKILAGRPHQALAGNNRRLDTILLPYRSLTFADLSRTLSVGATDLRSRRLRFFSSGPLVPVLRASTAIPLLIGKVRIEGRAYWDASVLDAFGSAEAVRMSRRLAGSAGAGSVVLLDASVGVGRGAQRRRAQDVVTGAGLRLVHIDVGSGGPRWSCAASSQGTEVGLDHAAAWLEGQPYERTYWGPRRSAGRRRY